MTPTHPRRRARTWLVTGAVALGLGVGAAGLASAATDDSTPADTSVLAPASGDQTAPPADGQLPPVDADRPDPASLPNGPGETVLTGDELAKVTAAAQAAQPDATIIRVETDNEGHAYEAHVQLADGSYMTLYFDESFAADGTDVGFGPMHGDGHHGPHGQPPADGQAPGDGTGTTDGTGTGTGGTIDAGPADTTNG